MPDVVLMDVRMPRIDGIETTRRIIAGGLPTRVIMLTTFDVDEHIYDALRAGTSRFLLKDVAGAQIMAAVERAAQAGGHAGGRSRHGAPGLGLRRTPCPAQQGSSLDSSAAASTRS